MERIFGQIQAERAHQDALWGGPVHDDTHGIQNWISYIVVYLGRAAGPETDWGRDLPIVRPLLIKVAALAVAAIQALDRYELERDVR